MLDSLPDKDKLYGKFQQGPDWRDKLSKKLAHKAVDIPEDEDMNINVQNGIGWKGLAIVMAGLLGGGWLMVNQSMPIFEQPGPVDSEYEVRFYDAQGNPIEIPRLSE